MKLCLFCQAALQPGALFCGSCGRSVQPAPQAQYQAGNTGPQYQYAGTQPGPQNSGPQSGPEIGYAPGAQQNVAGAAQYPAPPGLNWGAFLIPFVWGPANNCWVGLIALVGFIPNFFTMLISLGVSIYLLVKGNEMAWRSGRAWQSVEEFRAVQKSWVVWGLVAAAVTIVLSMMAGAAMVARGGYGGF